MSPSLHARLGRGVSLVTTLAFALAAPSFALAARKGTAARDTQARSAPTKVAPLVQDVASGTPVKADDAAVSGWRRVELPGAKFGYVPDADLTLEATPEPPPPPPEKAAPTPPVPAPAAAAASPPTVAEAPAPVQPLTAPVRDGRTLQYVTDFSHLAQLVKSDPEIFSMADGLVTRRNTATAVVVSGVLGGLVMRILATTALREQSCVALPDDTRYCAEQDSKTLNNVGMAMLVLSPLVGAVLWPKRSDQTRVINAWNAKHPRRPFVDNAGVELP
jgi:hypothetical protein